MNKSITASDNLKKELQLAIADLRQVDARLGLLRFVIIGIMFFSLLAIAWSSSNLARFAAITAIEGIFYAFWLICTHDMMGSISLWR